MPYFYRSRSGGRSREKGVAQMSVWGQIAITIPVVFMIYLIGCTLKSLINVSRRGVSYTQDLMDAGVSLRTLRDASLPEQDPAGLVSVREGMLFSVDKDGKPHIRVTRTLGRDEF
jgi:hypothetical protein